MGCAQQEEQKMLQSFEPFSPWHYVLAASLKP
jgi:hypothetical protein